MGFTSLSFLVFFLFVLMGYLLIPGALRRVWLLAASFVFLASYGISYLLILLISILVTYPFARILERESLSEGVKRGILAAAVLLHGAALAFFKYNTQGFLLPVGMSFYTFQAIGYLADVGRHRIPAEHNLLTFALFQAYFPKLVQGPIERGDGLLAQLEALSGTSVRSLENLRQGGLLLLWGLCEKLLIADRIAIPVDAVFSQFGAFGGVEILLAVVLYAFQIYADFAGYTDIARGISRMLGIRLLPNFCRPYMADSLQDFWRRWHQSLSSWLRDYIYIPLGGSRRGRLRRAVNILITFLVSGLWHGTGWHYILWGLLHGLGQVFDIRRWRLPRWLKRILVFLFVDLTWMVFRVNSLGDLKGMLYLVVTNLQLKDYQAMNLSPFGWVLLLGGLVLLILKDILSERGICLRGWILARPWPVRALIYAALLGAVIVFGVYGSDYDTSQFLYTQF